MSHTFKWSRYGFSHSSHETEIAGIYGYLRDTAPDGGFRLIKCPDWGSKYHWDSEKTTWLKFTNRSENVVLCINQLSGHIECLILGRKDVLPWEDFAIEADETQVIVNAVRIWWVKAKSDFKAKNAG